MSVISHVFRRAMNRRFARIESWMEDPFPVQEKTLLSLLRTAEKTRFGRQHGFESIRSIGEFQKRVPIGEYLDFKDHWEGCFRGEADITWPGRIKYFPITSGTTAGNKLIPLSPQGVRSNLMAGKDALFFYIQETGSFDLFNGKMLYLGGSTDLTPGEGGTLIGDLSGIMNLYVPWYARPFRTPSSKISVMKNWEQKLGRIVEMTVKQDVRGVTGIPSWLIILFDRVLDRVEAVTGRRPESLCEVWPRFQLLIHGGISFEPYRRMFEEYFAHKARFLEVYPASEGFVAMQNELSSRDLLLMLDYGVFYEFVPVDKLQESNPPRLTVAEVETGVNYAIIMSTNSGLWSYLLGDTVRFTSLRPLKLTITGRTKHFLSAFGEHLIVEEVEEAVTRASKEFELEVSDFHVAPIFPSDARYKPRHQWIIEAVRMPERIDLNALGLACDAVVQERNDDYAAHRQGGTGLDPPRVVIVPHGTFYAVMKQIGKLGGQHKVPRLFNDRSFADQLVAAADEITKTGSPRQEG